MHLIYGFPKLKTMLRTALTFVENTLSQYLVDKDPLIYTDQNSVVALAGLMNREGTPINLNAHIHITLVGLEEEKMEGKRLIPVAVGTGNDKKFKQLPPPYLVNAYLLFTAVHNDYATALRDISLVLSFFQEHPIFEDKIALNTPTPGKPWQYIEKLIFNLHTLSFEQQNNLWAALGAKYLPHAVFKMRLITVFGNDGAEAEAIKELAVNGHNN